VYIADYGNARIRKVDTSGVITTVAGNGNFGFSGDGGPATAAGMHPFSLAVDGSGNLSVADYDNRRILKIDQNGLIHTTAGNGNSGFAGDGGAATSAAIAPAGIAFDALGNLYIADVDNNRVRKLSSSGVIQTIAGNGTNAFAGDGGAAVSASLAHPEAVA